MANDSQQAQRQQRLFADPETKLYRALTSGKCIQDNRVTDFAFRLRPASADFPAETTLSVAITPDLAMGDLDCKGYTELLIGDIEKIEGLSVQAKEAESNAGYFEIVGIPADDVVAQTDYSLARAKIAGPVHRVQRRRR